MTQYEAILIPGGGVKENGELPPWVKQRLDHAIEIHTSEYIITLSAGTVHKAPPVDAKGFPIFESCAGAQYLIKHGIQPEKILTETSSYDTIGNAYFSRIIHVEPAKFKHLLIITSQFHMPRTKAIFQWLYGLDTPPNGKYSLTFEAVPDLSIPTDDLQARSEREATSLKQFQAVAPTLHTLHACHHWLFTKHNAYSVSSPPIQATNKAINTY